MVNGVSAPGSPFKVKVIGAEEQKPSIQNAAVIGTGVQTAVVGTMAEFIIDGLGAGQIFRNFL